MTNPLLEAWSRAMGFGEDAEAGAAYFATTNYMDRLLFRVPGKDSMYIYSKRQYLTRQYAWSVPTAAALDIVARYSAPAGLLSIGAGTGYWEAMIASRGVDVIAYDREPPSPKDYTAGGNGHGHKEQYFPVRKGTHRMVRSHPTRTLFLAWPSYDEMWAAHALEWTHAEHVIYIGEGPGGCTADDTFHDHLEHDWNNVATVDLPQWPGIHDRLMVFRRARPK